MAVLQADDLTALIIATQKDKGPKKVHNLATDIQEFVAFTQLMKKRSVRLLLRASQALAIPHKDSALG